MAKRKTSNKVDVSKRLKANNPNNDGVVEAETAPMTCLMADALFGCTDVVSVIFSFLDVRQLLRFVCVSKEFKDLLTYDHVVRTTMLSGGFPLTSLERLVPPIRRRKIWIPSPLRMLRTVCGKRCERCDGKNRFVCDSFGVFLCKKCLNNSTKLFRRSRQWKDYLDTPRISLGPRKGTTGQSHMYLMLTPMKDAGDNKVGPLVTVQDLEAMMSCEEDPGESSSSPRSPAEKVAAWMQKCDDQQPQADAAVKSILKALEDNRQDAVKRRATILEEKEEARDKFGEARRKNSDELLANLTALLNNKNGDNDDDDDDPDSSIAILNSRQWSSRQNTYFLPQESIVRKLLVPVLRAPSKYKAKKSLQDLAEQIRLITGEKKLMEGYIQQIIDHCDHPDTDEIVLRRNYRTHGFLFHFSNPAIRDILKEPLSKPRDLNYEIVQQLADRVKTIALRKGPGEEVLQKLKVRLKDLPCVSDLDNRNWNSWNWSWMFKETYIQDILYDPISKPEEITQDQLNELEQQLRITMEKKTLVENRMELLLAPIAKSYPAWYSKLRLWKWNSRTNLCTHWSFHARRVMGKHKLEHVEQMDDAKIGELSNHLLTEIKKQESSGFRLPT